MNPVQRASELILDFCCDRHIDIPVENHDEIAQALADAGLLTTGLQSMETAPRDGRYVLALMTGADDRWTHLNGRAFVIRHEGGTGGRGWAVFPGFGGVPDGWFSGWLALPGLMDAAIGEPQT